MKEHSYFYCGLEFPKGKEPKWLGQINQYSSINHKRTYIQRFPVTDTENDEYESNFILMIEGFQLCLVQQSDDDTFKFYSEDVEDSISYLFRKYNYRPVLGPFSRIKDTLLTSVNEKALEDINGLINNLQLGSELDKRHSELLIALCIGSPNEIERVGNDVPQTILEKVKHKIQLFDGDQTRFIYQKLNNPIVRIQGLSGTGKTELLLHKIKELYLNKEQYKIFFTCHNKILATKLHERIEKFFDDMKVNKQIAWDKRLWCTNAWGRSYDYNTGFYSYICHHYGIPFQGFSYNTSFNSICEQAIQQLNQLNDFEPCFDYVIVDESQDFDDSFFELCKTVTRRQVYLAGDIFQSIFAEHIEKAYKADFLLGKCYRTAPDTLMFAHALGLGLFEAQRFRWLDDEDWVTCGYRIQKDDKYLTLSREPVSRFDGDDEEYESIEFKYFSEGKLADGLCSIIKQLQKETDWKVQPDDIAVIYIDDNKKIYKRANILDMSVLNQLGWSINKAYETKDTIEGQLFVSNRYNSKGLEFPYVICVTDGIIDDYHYRNSIYTMLSRSFIKSFLVISGENPSLPKEITDGWKQISTEHKMTISIPTEEQKAEIALKFTEAKKSLSLRETIEEYASRVQMTEDQKNKMFDIMKVLQLGDLGQEDMKAKIEEIANLVRSTK